MIVKTKIKKEEIQEPFTKAAADIKTKAVSLGGEFHMDCLEELIKDGSEAKDVWGFNIYPDGRIDFISLINIRPQENNRSMEIKNPEICQKIKEIIKDLW